MTDIQNLDIIDEPIDELPSLQYLLETYLENRKHKRWKPSSIRFEQVFELELIRLLLEYHNGTYKISQFDTFIIDDPSKREVFAADYRDRISQAIIVKETNDSLEAYLSDSCYNCRLERGSLRACLKLRDIMINAPNDYYVLGYDLRSFFMSINREVTSNDFNRFLDTNNIKYKDLIKELSTKIIITDPTKDCIRKSPESAWNDLPTHKSLFNRTKGLPIGDQFSQSLCNFILTVLDIMIEVRRLDAVRYVDDGRVVGPLNVLIELINDIDKYLYYHLGIHLNRRKLFFRPITQESNFVGYRVGKYGLFPGKRIIAHVHKLMYIIRKKEFNTLSSKLKLQATINSYLGFMVHSRSYLIRKALVMEVLKKNLGFYSVKGFTKILLPKSNLNETYIFN